MFDVSELKRYIEERLAHAEKREKEIRAREAAKDISHSRNAEYWGGYESACDDILSYVEKTELSKPRIDLFTPELVTDFDTLVPKYLKFLPENSYSDTRIRFVVGSFFVSAVLKVATGDADTTIITLPSKIFKGYSFCFSATVPVYECTIAELQIGHERKSCYIPNIGMTWHIVDSSNPRDLKEQVAVHFELPDDFRKGDDNI